jgi:hypothetical protein
MLNKDEIQAYEEPLLDRIEMLEAARLPNERVHFWEKKGLGRVRTGRGNARRYSLGETLYYAYLGVLAQAGLPLDAAGSLAAGTFPAVGTSVCHRIGDLLRASPEPHKSPRILAVVCDTEKYGWRQLLVSKQEADEAVAPVPQGSLWAVVIDLTAIVNITVNGARGILKARKD